MADDKTVATVETSADEQAVEELTAKLAARDTGPADTTDADAAAAAGQHVTSDSESSVAQPAGSAAQDDPSGVTDGQYNAAKHLGYTEAEIATMDPQLAGRVEQESKRLRQHGSELGQRETALKGRAKELETLAQAKVSATAPATAAGTEAGTASKPTDGDNFDALSKRLGDFSPLSPDDVDDEKLLAKRYNDLLDVTRQVHGQIAAVRHDVTTANKAVATIQAGNQDVAEQEMARETQEFIGKVDHDIFSTFGRGETSALHEGSPELAARTRLTERANALREIHRQDGERVSTAQCLDEALMQLWPEQYKEAAQQPVKKKTEKIAKSQPARASDTQKAPAASEGGEEAAVRKLDADLRKHGLPTKPNDVR